MAKDFIVKTDKKILSKWVTLERKTIFSGSNNKEIFHCLKPHDYTTALIELNNSKIPIVKQYRSAIEDFSYELPGGLLDNGDSPDVACEREIYEETGYKASKSLEFLGHLMPDTGRLSNKLWAYYGNNFEDLDPKWHPEEGLETILVSKLELKELVKIGKFRSSQHLAVISLAIANGFFSWE